MDVVITWNGLFRLLLVLLVFYWAIKLAIKLIQFLVKRNSIKKNLENGFQIFSTLYKGFALILLLLGFVKVNYLVHGILLLVLGAVGFNYIKSFLNGIHFKLNPLVDKGAFMVTGEYQGIIEKLLPLGLIIKDKNKERFINYSQIETEGFLVYKMEDDSLYKVLYVHNIIDPKQILDLLFINPLINFKQKPSLKKILGNTTQKLQLTLERGARIEEVVAYLNANKIEASLVKNQ